MTLLTQTHAAIPHNLSIPTAARGQVRAFIKGQPGWDKWLAARNIESREARNQDLLDYASENGLMDAVLEIIARNADAPVVKTKNPLVHYDVESGGDFADAMRSLKAKEEPAMGAFEASAILKDVDQFLSPLVRGEIEKALAEVVAAANKPAVVQEVEKIVQREVMVDKHGVVVAPKAPTPVKTGATIPFNKLFSTHASGDFGKREITLWNSHGYAPEVDKFYVVDAQVMATIALAAECGDYVWQVGPSGSGKTTNPRQFAAYTGRRFFEVTCTKHTDVSDLVGRDGAKGGETFWQDGALLEAVKVPGAVILIDEPTLASPGVQAIFQAITDDSRTYTVHATGEVVKIAQGVFFIVADNTNGAGDETGQYAGTHQANAALVNRFRRMVKVDYMSKAQEAKALVNWTSVPLPAAEHVVDFFARARRLPEMEGIVMSLRQMTGFVRTVKDGFTSKYAFEVSVLNKLPATERAVVEALATLDWHDSFELLLTGAAAPVTNTPSDTLAAKAFDDGVTV